MILISWKELFRWIVLGIFIISLAITITINFTPLYYYFVYHYQLASLVNLSSGEVISEYHRLLAYLNFPWITHLKLIFPSTLAAKQHFEDVKHLFLINYLCLVMTVFPASKYLSELKKTSSWWRLMPLCRMVVSILIVILLFAGVDFNDFFIFFHRALFRNQDWLFDPSKDPIIKVLPENFFAAAFGLFFLILLFSLSLGFFLGKKSLKKRTEQ
ncbi:MAG: TIGR01906 family membrane protein [Liquorilactobacillus ghanensis]|uniref:Intergral membrane protein n=3 Tax=Liquorilactobacillus ghanensis TaxID=399370 RepID=A0A0R1VNH0_9LACO|nr:TIGR01906 family membrane protein [Liquorilactobacillus ghanensis]KRM06941.1 intergral membrane protein [Liquorilactobacillus ghanensis DSM 18630]